MSKKARSRSASRDADAPLAFGVPEPAVFRDMRIEEGRISDGRRIIYFSWPEGAAPEAAAVRVESPAADERPTASAGPTFEASTAGPVERPAADEDWPAAELPPVDEDSADV